MSFENGNSLDGKHYWLTPPELMADLQMEFEFNFDPCPYPLPEHFDGLDVDWGSSSYVNPPFGVVMHKGKKKGATAWARKCIEEHRKGKRVVMVYPIDKWVLMLIEAGAKVRNLRDVRWLPRETIACGDSAVILPLDAGYVEVSHATRARVELLPLAHAKDPQRLPRRFQASSIGHGQDTIGDGEPVA